MRWVAIISLIVATGACSTTGSQDAKAPSAAPLKAERVDIGDDELGSATYDVLLRGTYTPHRLGTLVAVVRKQLARAQSLFEAGYDDAGLATVSGALYLVRDGELRSGMLDGVTTSLQSAAAVVARAGNEGLALALYNLLLQKLPEGPERQEVSDHFAALAEWRAATASDGVMQSSGAVQRTAVHRSLFEPTPQARRDAEEATLDWISKALAYSGEQSPPRNNFEREEAVEAYRAVRTGALALVALHLRHGDAQAALASIERGDVSQIVSPSLLERITAAAEENDPAAWADLFGLYESVSQQQQTEASLDQILARAASWGCAMQLFRAEPSDLRAMVPLSNLLLEGGLAEVAPVIFDRQLTDPDNRQLSWVLGFTLQAIVGSDSVGDVGGARRTFAHAKRFLDAADRPASRGNVKPSTAHLRYVMGSIEARAGELTQARAHLQGAVRDDPTASALSLLAAIDRQRGDEERALESLDAVLDINRRAGDRASEAETLLQKASIYAEQGKAAQAREALRAALSHSLDARRLANSGVERATAERGLARVLEEYGDEEGARRAADRAYDAAPNDVRQVSATLLDSARRALTMGDLGGARKAVERGLDAALPPEDLVYLALWLRLVELRLGEHGDGTFEEALAEVENNTSWASRLKAWALGKITDDALVGFARSRVEQVEAKFYVAMRQDVRGQEENTRRQLREVSSSEAIQLVEVEIARDLVASRENVVGNLPTDVKLP